MKALLEKLSEGGKRTSSHVQAIKKVHTLLYSTYVYLCTVYRVHVLNGVAGGPLAYAAVHGGHAEPGEVNPHHLTEKKIFFTEETSKVVADSWGQNFSNSLPC